jgi:hypothetical protein
MSEAKMLLLGGIFAILVIISLEVTYFGGHILAAINHAH